MLMKTEINPFESQETKPYKTDPRIEAMTELVDAYQRKEIHRYESILDKNRSEILSDPFIRAHIEEVTRNIRTEALLRLIAPFTRFSLAFIAKQLNIDVKEVQEIIGFLILDKKIKGRINMQKGTVEMETNIDTERLQAMKDWSKALEKIGRAVLNDGEGFRMGDDMASAMGIEIASRDKPSQHGQGQQQEVGVGRPTLIPKSPLLKKIRGKGSPN